MINDECKPMPAIRPICSRGTNGCMVQHKRPVVKLVGEDGNVFNIIGKVSRILAKECGRNAANAFIEKATKAESYDEVLSICLKYCEVK